MIKFGINKQPLDKREHRNILFWTAVSFLVLGYSGIITPSQNQLPECLYYSVTGHECPGCGLTRSFFATARPHFSEAFKYHKMGTVLYIIIFMIAGLGVSRIITNKRIFIFPVKIKIWFLSLLALFYFSFWLI